MQRRQRKGVNTEKRAAGKTEREKEERKMHPNKNHL